MNKKNIYIYIDNMYYILYKIYTYFMYRYLPRGLHAVIALGMTTTWTGDDVDGQVHTGIVPKQFLFFVFGKGKLLTRLLMYSPYTHTHTNIRVQRMFVSIIFPAIRHDLLCICFILRYPGRGKSG